MKADSQESKQRILDAALDVFFEVGFEGARVSDIAKRAQVNQALIYYYFKSKEELLTALINIHIDEMVLLKSQLMKNKSILNKKDVNEVADEMMDFLKDKKKIFSILFGEMIKNSGSEKINKAFEFFSPIMEDRRQRLNVLEIDPEGIDRGIIAGFFFGMMPLTTYIMVGEKWADYCGFDKKLVKETFDEFLYDFYIESITNYLKRWQK
ncbi:TetR/AcrR family transcriptional regulator [Geosporobacter ferrireducens]|uniref:TetR/AcrR family transcriptional regulator n=1 Tax=Geosporobacter ferrireducens TaxID=1424294 RepID=UPI00139CC866|nr:TetR/AcrR family transcriptional regulator [Geosporobacter ferrireducens]MTI54298.1 TetR/AcrR family transcriptional regulator [Geosporobacter ferrireducens]